MTEQTTSSNLRAQGWVGEPDEGPGHQRRFGRSGGTSAEVALLIARRLLVLPVLLFVISLGVFSLLYIAPGSVETALVGAKPTTPKVLQEIRHQYHLDEPFFTQYWIWSKHALRLDFGRSIETFEPVRVVIERRMSTTLFLGFYGFIITMVGGILLGTLASIKRRTVIDRSVVSLSVIALSAPAFATGIVFLYIFAVVLHWFPVYGEGVGFSDRLWHLALPALALALSGMALVVKLTRAGMINALEQDYVAFAYARGVPTSSILVHYAFRNALIPVLTSAGLILAHVLTGAVLIEVTFALPGIGSALVEAVSYKDVPMVQGIAITIATIIILVNMLTDVAYVLADPRVRFGRTEQ